MDFPPNMTTGSDVASRFSGPVSIILRFTLSIALTLALCAQPAASQGSETVDLGVDSGVNSTTATESEPRYFPECPDPPQRPIPKGTTYRSTGNGCWVIPRTLINEWVGKAKTLQEKIDENAEQADVLADTQIQLQVQTNKAEKRKWWATFGKICGVVLLGTVAATLILHETENND